MLIINISLIKKEIDNLKNELNDIKTPLSNDKSREDKIVQLKNEVHFLSNKILSDKKEIDTINSKLNNTDSLLQQQINIHSYLSPIVFFKFETSETFPYYNEGQYMNGMNFSDILNNEQKSLLIANAK